jgi:hypothetical protein
VFGYVPGTPEHDDPHPLLAAGATAIFGSMDELPALVC